MIWQDLVISIGVLVMIVAMFPSVCGHNKPAKETSLTTAIILTTYFVCFATLGLWFSAFTEAILAGLWYVLYFQVKKETP